MTEPSVSPAPRPATAADAAAVERLLSACDLPTAGVAEILASHPDDFLVVDAERGRRGELDAVAGLEVRGDNALLRSVAVSPRLRGTGVGQALVQRLVDGAEARGLHGLYLLTTTAERWFPRFGFEPIDRAMVPAEIAGTVAFRSACPASAAVMAKALGDERRG